jgi:hypothetical protein
MTLGNNNILLNGVAYDWGTIILLIEGVPVVGISSISFNETMNSQNLFGTGLYPIHTGFGKINSSASITLNADEIFALQNVAVNGILQNIPPFDIIITYMMEELNFFDSNAKLPRTIILKNCRFTNVGMDISQGDMDIKYQFNLSISHIIWKPITQDNLIKYGGLVLDTISELVGKKRNK